MNEPEFERSSDRVFVKRHEREVCDAIALLYPAKQMDDE